MKEATVTSTATILAVALSAPIPLLGQDDSAATPGIGDQVRVWAPYAGLQRETFEFQGWRADTLLLESSSQGALLLDVGRVQRLEVLRRSGGTHLVDGALIGGGVGFATGYGFWALLCTMDCADQSASKLGLTWGSVLAVPGVVLGALNGGLTPKTEWVDVSEGLLEDTRQPNPGTRATVSIRMSLPFPR